MKLYLASSFTDIFPVYLRHHVFKSLFSKVIFSTCNKNNCFLVFFSFFPKTIICFVLRIVSAIPWYIHCSSKYLSNYNQTKKKFSICAQAKITCIQNCTAESSHKLQNKTVFSTNECRVQL